MSVGDVTFLALGLILGIVSGAALVEILRARPHARHEVRVTIAPDAVPRRRPATLAADAFTRPGAEPARGGPADRRMLDVGLPPGLSERRTGVRSHGPVPTRRDGSEPGLGRTLTPTLPLGSPPATTVLAADGRRMAARLTAIPIVAGPDAFLQALRRAAAEAGWADVPGVAPAAAVAVASRPVMEARSATRAPVPRRAIPATVGAQASPAPRASAAPDRRSVTPAIVAPGRRSVTPAIVAPRSSGAGSWPFAVVRQPVTRSGRGATATVVIAASAAADAGGPTPAAASVVDGPCAEERRIAAERCELATRARARADEAAEAVRLAQRSYDAHEGAADAAAERADPRAVQAAKEAAQAAFRAAVAAASTPDGLEAAARDWLTEINRVNTEARDAASTVTRERAAAREIGGRLERLALEADAARISAENADAACLAARTAVADCDELGAQPAPESFLVPPAQAPAGPRLDQDESLGIAIDDGGSPMIFRLLRGDRAAMTSFVGQVAGDDPEARRHWQLLTTRLLEVIIADAIEASALEFPDDHPFWGAFSREQRREITHALASLGYRFDGLGGWLDGRVPSQRDLSLAVGYAGLDPMRIRNWPAEDATAALFAEATVSADEYLAGMAGDLTLAEMVTMLGRRADGLAEAWNAWGRIRPLLLQEG